MGTNRFYFTGGEPFIREDIFELIDYVCNHKESELIILTNGTLLKGEYLKRLQKFDKELTPYVLLYQMFVKSMS